MHYRPPPRLLEPLLRLINAVNISTTRREQELASHERCENRLCVSWVSPKIHEQYPRFGRYMLAHPPEKMQHPIGREAMHDVLR